MKKVAVTDFDGTLSKGYISMDFMDYLVHERLYDAKSYNDQRHALIDYKENRITYDAWCKRWGELWAEGLKGRDTKLIASAADDFFTSFKKNIYPSSYKIIDFLRKDHDLMMLSVGAYEVASLAAKELGIDNVIGTTLDHEMVGNTDKYTGQIKNPMHIPGSKEVFISSLDKKPHIGLGDSMGDIGFLRLVTVPIVLNPEQKMLNYAKNNQWVYLYSTEDTRGLINEIDLEIRATDFGILLDDISDVMPDKDKNPEA